MSFQTSKMSHFTLLLAVAVVAMLVPAVEGQAFDLCGILDLILTYVLGCSGAGNAEGICPIANIIFNLICPKSLREAPSNL